MKNFLKKQKHFCRVSFLLFLVISFAFCIGCAKEEPAKSFEETQAEEDEEWIRGAKRPPSPETMLALSRILVTQGKDDEAEFTLDKCTKEYPDFVEAYVELAELHMRHRRVDSAIKILDEGMIQVPGNDVLMNDTGMCHFVLRQYRTAEKWFRQAAGVDPNNTRYRANIALALGLQGRYEESFAVYEQILSKKDAHHNLAVICDARKDIQRAEIERAAVRKIEKEEEARRLEALAEQEKNKNN